jgi:acyl carrier protein
VTRNDVIAKMQEVMADVLDLDDLAIDASTTAKDVEGWDSLSHIRLVVAMERAFKLKFTTGEIERFQNVGDMADAVVQKTGG